MLLLLAVAANAVLNAQGCESLRGASSCNLHHANIATQSEPDKIRSTITKIRTVGNAAFADYSINIGALIGF